MNNRWETRDRSTDKRGELWLKSQKIPFRHRIDLLLPVAALGLFLLLGLLWGVGVIAGDRLGWFREPNIKELKDPRILVNVRDNIHQSPILDAAKFQGNNNIYISRADGTVHRFHPPTDSWKTSGPGKTTHLLEPGIRLLGADQWLWGLSRGGGLLRHDGKDWLRVFGDSYFMGAGNQPVPGNHLNTAAVSPDKEWLAVGTHQEGIGVYHLPTRHWLPVPKNQINRLPSFSITHITYWRGAFRIGGSAGLSTLIIQNNTPFIDKSPDIKGKVIDMTVDHADRLWVLEQGRCGGGNCIRLSRFDDPFAAPQILVDERNRYPNLTIDNLHYARFKSPFLVIAGDAGFYTYDTRYRSWKQHVDKPVHTVLPPPGDNRFYFGYTGGIGYLDVSTQEGVSRARGQLFQAAGARFEKMCPGPNGEIVALDRSGKIYSLKQGKISALRSTGRTILEPSRFKSAFSFGDIVLFTGPEGILVHDIVKRTYRDIPARALPAWLNRPYLQFLNVGDSTYITAGTQFSADVFRMSTQSIQAGNFKNANLAASIDGPVGPLRNWNNKGAAVVTGGKDGKVYRFTPSRIPLTGKTPKSTEDETLLDVTPYKSGMMATTRKGLLYYDYNNRTWKMQGSPADTFCREVGVFEGNALAATDDGRLLGLKHNGKFEDLIGDTGGFGFSDDELSDVRERNGLLYLAGAGKIYCYNPKKRKITNRWTVDPHGRRAVFIKGFIKEQPLSLCAFRALVGEKPIEPGGGLVTGLSMDPQYIWAVRRDGRRRYLKRYRAVNPFGAPSETFFHRPGAGSGITRIYDATQLDDGTVAVATDRNLRFYSPSARSWLQALPFTWIPRGSRVIKLGRYLALTGSTRQGHQVTFLDLDSVQIPKGTSELPVTLGQIPQKLNVRAYALNPAEGRAAFIADNGAVVEWRGGRMSEVLPENIEGPAPSELRRVFDRHAGDGGFLLFTTDSGLLRCDLDIHSWSKRPFRRLDGAIVNANLEKEDQKETITVKTASGNIYLKSILSPVEAPKPGAPGIFMNRVYSRSGRFGDDGRRILDVQQRGMVWWTFVLTDRIKYYNPREREWHRDVLLPGASGNQKFYKVGDLGVVVDNNNKYWWVARQKGDHPGDFARFRPTSTHTTALDSGGNVWRYTREGHLYRIRRPIAGDYPENVHSETFLYEKPFYLDPDRVRKAVKLGTLMVFETRDGIRVLDLLQRREKEPGQTERSFGNIRSALRDPGNKDRWSELKRRMMRLPGGRLAYDPIIGIFTAADGQLFARRPGGDERLAGQGVVLFKNLPAPLDVEWLKWNRQHNHFEIRTPGGMVSMKPAEFVRQGRMLFEDIDALLALSEKEIYAANQRGIIRYSRNNLSLTDGSVSFRPMNWRGPFMAAHGGFVTGSGFYSPAGNPAAGSQREYKFSVGDVELREDIIQRRVRAALQVRGKRMNAFGSRGFIWDHGAEDIFYARDSTLWMRSNAGIHPVQGYRGFRGGRNLPPLLPDQVRSGSRSKGNPTRVDTGAWTWKRADSGMRVTLRGKNFNFKLQVGADGLGFTSDRLRDAVSVGGKLYVITDAFIEEVDPVKGPADFEGRRFSLSDSSILGPVRQVLERQGVLAALPISDPLLRFRKGRGRRIGKEMRIQTNWVPFRFRQKRFPFDVVTSVEMEGNRLKVGTLAGTTIYNAPLNTGLTEMQLTGGVSAAPAVDRVRLETGFWRFVKRAGRLEGRYKNEKGIVTSTPVTLERGRVTHDRVSDIIVYGGRAFTLWTNGWVTRYADVSLELKKGILQYNLQDMAPWRFIPVPRDVTILDREEKSVSLTGGLYLECRGQRILRFDVAAWREITDRDIRVGLVDYANRQRVVNKKNLVLSSPDFTFKRQGLDGKWHHIPWRDGRVALDNWSDLFYLDNHLWGATSAGLVRFSRGTDGKVVLNPDDFTVIPGPLVDKRGIVPEITDLRLKGTHLQVRCEADSEKVFTGELRFPLSSERGIFRKLDRDPFVERELVNDKETGFWSWELKGRKDRNPGWLEGRFRGEEIQIIGGRFDFDTIHSLAYFKDRDMEIGTEAAGWFRAKDGVMALSGLERPGVRGVDAAEVRGVMISGSGEERVLAMRSVKGDCIRLSRDDTVQRTGGCREFLGDDEFWRYEKEGELLVISASRSKGGSARREMAQGRFTDDVVNGLPVTVQPGEEKNGILYYIPTQAGVLGLDGDLRRREIHVGEFPGIAQGVPRVIHAVSKKDLLYAGDDGMHVLEGSREIYPEISLPVPRGAEILAIEKGTGHLQDFVHIRWQVNQVRGWTLVKPGEKDSDGDNYIFVHAGDFIEFIKNRETWNDPSPWLQLNFAPTGLTAQSPGVGTNYNLPYPGSLQLLAPIPDGETLYLIGSTQLYQINLEHALFQLYGE